MSVEKNKEYLKFSEDFWKEFRQACLAFESIEDIFEFSNDVYPKIHPIITEVYERVCNSFDEEIKNIVLSSPKEHKKYLESYLNHIYNCFENSLYELRKYLEEEFKNSGNYEHFGFYCRMAYNSLNLMRVLKVY